MQDKKNWEMRCKTKKNGKTRPGQKKWGDETRDKKNGETRRETKQGRIHNSISHVRWAGAETEVRSPFG